MATASDSFTIKQGDTLPVLIRGLNDANGPIDLTAATAVQFHMKSGGVLKVDAACSITAPATTGVVQYDWIIADTDTIGVYLTEFQVTFTDGTVLTVPNTNHMLVNVVEELG